MAANWRALAARLDAYVDGTWAEPVELHPMVPGDIDTNPQPDPARRIVKTLGVFMKPGASIIGEGGLASAYGGNLHTIAQEAWVSIADERLVIDLLAWKQHDRVYFPDRDEWYEIAWTDPSATMRSNIHLLR